MLLNLVLSLLGLFYYIPFVNRGIVLYDEGYYLHIANRIIEGQVPYKDFFLQFSPFYFYILSLVLKVFGEKVIVERIFILLICFLIIFFLFHVVDKISKVYFKLKILIFLSIISFGFPLINNSGTLAWISVLFSIFIIYSFAEWWNKKRQRNIFLIGFLLMLLVFTKQNLGLYFLLLTNLFVFTLGKENWKNILSLNIIPMLGLFILFELFFGGNPALLNNFIEFNKRYTGIYHLSYPFISTLITPFGFIKIIPYYVPIIYLFILLRSFKNKNKPLLFFMSISLLGFFGTVIPTSDLLHVYPFYSLILIGGLLILKKKTIPMIIILIAIFSGFYLTFFKEYYRYQPAYYLQNTPLKLERAEGIFVDKPLANELSGAKEYLNSNLKNGNVLVYPFSPMLYFIYSIENPSRYSIYYPGYLTKKEEENVLKELVNKKVEFIITVSDYTFNTPISKFIQRQKEVYNNGIIKIFKIS